jgi:predicted HTH domain antitoxin
MSTIKLNIPVNTKYNEQELKEFFVAKLYEEGMISTGTGAKILNISKRDFMLLLSKYNVYYIDYDLSDYEKKIISNATAL